MSLTTPIAQVRLAYSHRDLPKTAEAEAKMSRGSRSVHAAGLHQKVGGKPPAGVLCKQVLLAGAKLEEYRSFVNTPKYWGQ